MTPEEKQLLLIDLCARLPYGALVFIRKPFGCVMSEEEEEELTTDTLQEFIENDDMLMRVLPYLRPMSSMTDEEENEFFQINFTGSDSDIYGKLFNVPYADEVINWLNAHHFDHRCLIEKGLALEAPKDMYKTE